MNCNKAKVDIGALLDGELESAEKAVLERHLQICTECYEEKDSALSLSNVLKLSRTPEPSRELRSRIKDSFKSRRPARQTIWQRIAFGAVVVPKPVFASLLVLLLAGFWLSFQLGKVNSSAVSMTAPLAEVSNYLLPNAATEKIVETVYVEVPVVKEKTVVKIVRVSGPRRSAKTIPGDPFERRLEALPTFNSTTTAKGLSNDVDLKGFQPPAEMNARVIKEDNHDEK